MLAANNFFKFFKVYCYLATHNFCIDTCSLDIPAQELLCILFVTWLLDKGVSNQMSKDEKDKDR